jgi:putative flippase GtrA
MSDQIIKYGIVTLLNYYIIFIGTYVLTDKMGIMPNLSYLSIISFVYLVQYVLNTKYVFSVAFTKKSAVRYVFFLIFFWLLNNIAYNLLIEVLRIQYLIAVGINIFFWGLIRFFIQKRYVFIR